MGKKKVLLIGWDSADWKVIKPLMDAGKMPNLARMVETGVMGNLSTLYPSLSPMLWTSIATGKRPFKHGVLGFSEPTPQGDGIRPVTNLSRKTRALWNILQLNDLKSNVVSWWPSHPAEPISGVMVSNHYQRANAPLDKPWPLQPGTVHPARLEEPLANLRLHPQQLMGEHILPFVPKLREIDQEKDKRIESVAKTLADCTTVNAAATALVQLEEWDFTAVYFDAIDHFSHGFMNYHPPKTDWVSEEDFDRYRHVVEGGYCYHDMMLGPLLDYAGDDTTVILISDHGFHSDHLRPRDIPIEPAGPAAQHRHYGIFAMKGPDIKQDELIYGASLLDIAPTILSVFDLPIGEDMDGKSLVNAFLKPPALKTIPSWDDIKGDDGSHPPEALMNPVESSEGIEQLVALGYIDKPNEDTSKAVEETVRELRYNEARSYMDANRHTEAMAILKELWQRWPDEYRFGIQLIQCYEAAEQIAEARPLLEELFKNKEKAQAAAIEELKRLSKEKQPKEPSEKEQRKLRKLRATAGRNPYAIEYLMGAMLFAENQPEEALEHLRKAEQADATVPSLYIKIGAVYLKMKHWNNAEENFLKALSIDPENAAAHLGLCRSYLPQRRNMEAVGAALNAVGLLYHNPHAHYLLGVALHRLGRIPKAIEALNVAVAQNPNFPQAWKRMAYIYEKRIKNPEAASEYRKEAVNAKKRIRDIRLGKNIPIADRSDRARTSDQEVLKTHEKEAAKMDSSSTITIVAGLPRSGTSMMMQMLDAGGLPPLADNERPADDDNPRGYYEFDRAKALRKDASWLPDAQGKVVKIVAQLLSSLPLGSDLKFRIIFIERNPDEVLSSQKLMLTHRKEQGAQLSDDNLKKTFAQQVTQIKRMLSVRKIPTLCMNYSQVVADPIHAAQRLNTFMGGELSEESMVKAVDPTLYRHKK